MVEVPAWQSQSSRQPEAAPSGQAEVGWGWFAPDEVFTVSVIQSFGRGVRKCCHSIKKPFKNESASEKSVVCKEQAAQAGLPIQPAAPRRP